MPWLPMYLNKEGLNNLVSWLNNEVDIAFIVSDGPRRWRAVKAINNVSDGRFCLWNQQSGPLPLIREVLPDTHVVNPLAGWKEECAGAHSTLPYFGPGHPGVYWLDAQTISRWKADAIGLSVFEWIGNHYRAIGKEAPPVTGQWGERLRRWVKKQAICIPRNGNWDGPDSEIWAFAGALEEIKAGKHRDDNP